MEEAPLSVVVAAPFPLRAPAFCGHSPRHGLALVESSMLSTVVACTAGSTASCPHSEHTRPGKASGASNRSGLTDVVSSERHERVNKDPRHDARGLFRKGMSFGWIPSVVTSWHSPEARRA